MILEAPLAISIVLIHLAAFEAPTTVSPAPTKPITRLAPFAAMLQLLILPRLCASISLPPHRALSRQLLEPRQELPEQPPPKGASPPLPQVLGDPAI